MNIFQFAAQCDTAASNAILNSDNLPKTCADSNTINTLFMIAFVIIGALSVVLVIIAGIRYITAGGDPQKIATAKGSLMHALIGLAIAGLGAAIVNFVVDLL